MGRQMMVMKPFKNALLILLMSLNGCISMDQSVEVRNNSSNQVDSVTLTSSRGFNSRFGMLMPGAQSTVGGYKPIRRSDTCHLSWQDSTGKNREVTLDLAKELPKDYAGDLRFILNTNGTISVKPRD
jgi:hypothetical protein